MTTRFTIVLLASIAAGAGPASALINCAAQPFQPACCPAPCPVVDGQRFVQEEEAARQERTKAKLVDATNVVVGTVMRQYGTGVPAATPVELGLPPQFINDPLVAAAWKAATTSSGAASTQDAVIRLIVAEALARLHRLEFTNMRVGSAYPGWVTAVAGAATNSVWGQFDTTRRIRLTATMASSLAADVRAQGTARAAAVSDPSPQAAPAGRQAVADELPPARAADLVGTLVMLGQNLARQIDRNNLRAANIRNADRISFLRETQASYDAALQYESTQSTLFQGQIALAFLDPSDGAAAAKRLLKANDRTTYVDSWEKGPAAAAAGGVLYDVVNSTPEQLSTPSGLPFCADPQDDRPRPMQSCRDRLIEAAANWLEATKYLEWLRPFRDSAVAWEASLSGRIRAANTDTDGVLASRDPARAQADAARQLLAEIASAAGQFGQHPKLGEYQKIATILAAQATEPKVIAYSP